MPGDWACSHYLRIHNENIGGARRRDGTGPLSFCADDVSRRESRCTFVVFLGRLNDVEWTRVFQQELGSLKSRYPVSLRRLQMDRLRQLLITSAERA